MRDGTKEIIFVGNVELYDSLLHAIKRAGGDPGQFNIEHLKNMSLTQFLSTLALNKIRFVYGSPGEDDDMDECDEYDDDECDEYNDDECDEYDDDEFKKWEQFLNSKIKKENKEAFRKLKENGEVYEEGDEYFTIKFT